MLAEKLVSLPFTAIGNLPLGSRAVEARRCSKVRIQWQQANGKDEASMQRMLVLAVGVLSTGRHTLHRVQQGLAARRCSSGRDTLALIDGSYCLYQSFYAMRNRGGEAVDGFKRQLQKLRRVLQPSHFAVMLDETTSSSENLIRQGLLPTYKRHRQRPPDLITQFAKAKIACEALRVPWMSQERFEADDLIATYARDAAKRHCRVSIVSADKDLTQLMDDPLISIHNNLQDPLYQINREAVQTRWRVRPEQMIDLLALVGDAPDGVPGVPGIGKVKAAALLGQYENLDNIVERAVAGTVQVKGIGPKLQSMLKEHGDRALNMREVIKLQSVEKHIQGFNRWHTDFKVEGGQRR